MRDVCRGARLRAAPGGSRRVWSGLVGPSSSAPTTLRRTERLRREVEDESNAAARVELAVRDEPHGDGDRRQRREDTLHRGLGIADLLDDHADAL
jgi:hypothetical protein